MTANSPSSLTKRHFFMLFILTPLALYSYYDLWTQGHHQIITGVAFIVALCLVLYFWDTKHRYLATLLSLIVPILLLTTLLI